MAIAIAGLVFGREAAQGHIAEQLQTIFGVQASEAVQALVAHAQRPGAGIISAVVGGVVLLLGASGVFGELQDSLNTIWEVAPKPRRALWDLRAVFLVRRWCSVLRSCCWFRS